ncbi:MAG: roadblock/LC7 domain-containing protein [Candidatus Obscuribacterales bacterium]|nr:roadblock/LC7 domain-containing protein [Candidatus Obscuribacterales bacterium]
MYRLVRRTNLIPFLIILCFGIGASILVPQSFPQTIGDIPMFALFPGEIAIALILSVLLFENASPGDLIKISGIMVGIAMGAGAISNVVTLSTVMLPELTLKLNWVQMLAFNLTGLAAALAYYASESEDALAYRHVEKTAQHEAPAQAPSKNVEPAIAMEEPIPGATSGNHKEILSNLNIGRLNQLEQSISGNMGKVSLESLFAEETHAVSALSDKISFEEAIPLPEAAPVAETVSEQEVVITSETKLFNNDLGADLDNLFADIAPAESQKDFSPPAGTSTDTLSLPVESLGINDTSVLADAGTIAAKAVQEFGRLSSSVSAKPELKTPGTLKTIGQMLLDTEAVEKVIQQAEKNEQTSNWQVLNSETGDELHSLIKQLTDFEGVESALLIGKDGMLLSHSESLASEKYLLGPLALAIHSTTNLGTNKLQLGQLRHAFLQCGDKSSLVTDTGRSILAIFGTWEPSALDNLLDYVTDQTSGYFQETAIASPPPVEAAPIELKTLEPPKEESATPVEKPIVAEVSEQDVSSLFDNLLADDSAEKEAAPPVIPQPVAEEKPAVVLDVSDNEISGLFDNLLAEDSNEKSPETTAVEMPEIKPEPVIEKPTTSTLPKAPSEIKEFGKLSLNTAYTQETGQEQGSMKAIGRQLIDPQAVENIIRASEKRNKIGGMTTARVISAARGEGIQTLLKKIDTCEGVDGCLIVGHDGLVIASTLKTGVDKEIIGAMCNAIHSHLDVATQKIDYGKLHQAIFRSSAQLTVLTSVAVGILAVFVNETKTDNLNPLLSAIETTIHG